MSGVVSNKRTCSEAIDESQTLCDCDSVGVNAVDANVDKPTEAAVSPGTSTICGEGPAVSNPVVTNTVVVKRQRRNAIRPNSIEASQIRNVAVNFITETIVNDISSIDVNSGGSDQIPVTAAVSERAADDAPADAVVMPPLPPQ